MRCSDIKNLTWEQINGEEKKGFTISYRQQKTKGFEVLPINKEAYNIICSFPEREGIVFKGLVLTAYTNKILRKWVKDSGVSKYLTFHSSRHSFATNLLASRGTDIYTVGKLLGHKRIATTEIYTHVLQQSKVDAVNMLTL